MAANTPRLMSIRMVGDRSFFSMAVFLFIDKYYPPAPAVRIRAASVSALGLVGPADAAADLALMPTVGPQDYADAVR
jgi:hypothetical protein